MYLLSPVHELVLVGMFDAGVPNKERIVLRPTEALNLAGFGLMLCSNAMGGVTPIPDNFFWLGEKWIAPPSWIVVFTGPGTYREGAHQTTGEPVLELHWGKPNVVLQFPGIVVSIVRIGGISSHLTPTTVQAAGQQALPLTRGS